MPIKAKNYAITDLAEPGTMVLRLEDGSVFEVVQYTASFAINEIPRATCLVAIGRDARNTREDGRAGANRFGNRLQQMLKATITFHPRGEWRPNGEEWPNDSRVIFDGYYAGMGYRKVQDKVQAVVHLVHWLIDLTFSSVLSKQQHPSNPGSLVQPAVFTALAGAGDQPVFMGHLAGFDAIRPGVTEDLWAAVKKALCGLAADDDKFEVACGDPLGTGDTTKNSRALDALARIEGPSELCNKDYKYAVPTPLDDCGVPLVSEACAMAISRQLLTGIHHATFWDAMITQVFPMFQLALVPLVERALVVAWTPAFCRAYDKEITPDDYDFFDLNGALMAPLQGVGVWSGYGSSTGWERAEIGDGSYKDSLCLGGHYAVDSVKASDGTWLVVEAPAWLEAIPGAGMLAGSSSGIRLAVASNTQTTPGEPGASAPDPTPGEVISETRKLFNRYAHSVFVANMLHGRSGALDGKLRFDIAPGSIVRIEPKPELFLESGLDELATPFFAHVTRVTVNINSEAAKAGTSFQLSHMRTEAENSTERAAVRGHPLFKAPYYNGAPLVADPDEAWMFPEEGDSVGGKTANCEELPDYSCDA